uniref:[RNA-polymerase]-subunit kinase n=1 Tax=Myxobolus squamalis TaxID=59785 RepID=A0A6B2G3X8_MYXSQ
MTSLVVTRWYRSPELLYGAKHYGVGVDTWSIGCILCEMIKREPLFPGTADLDQLSKIFSIRGTPTIDDWPGMDQLPDFITFKEFPKINLASLFSAAPKNMISLMEGLLACNPNKRLSSTQALKHEYFFSQPHPTPPHMLVLNSCNQSQPVSIKPVKRSFTEFSTVNKRIKF